MHISAADKNLIQCEGSAQMVMTTSDYTRCS